MKKLLRLRPHHVLCLNYFIGKGYSGEFVENMFNIKYLLCQKPDEKIVIHRGIDCICAACPNNLGTVCRTQGKVAHYDAEVAETCGFTEETPVLWSECERLVLEKIIRAPGVRKKICFDCLWKTICQQQDVENSVENV